MPGGASTIRHGTMASAGAVEIWVTNVYREDLVEPDPDLRITRIYLEVLLDTPLPAVPAGALVPQVIVQSF